MMPGEITAQDYSMVCQLMWYLLAILPGLVCHLLKITQLVCQLIWCVLAMMHGVTTAQTCSTNVSADVACHDGWSDNCSRLLN